MVRYSTWTKQYLLQFWEIIHYFAKKLWKDEHYWLLVWVLHYIDWGYIEKYGSKHLKDDFEKIVSEINLPEDIIWDIRSHGYFLDWINE